MIEIKTPNPWAAVLTLQKDALITETEVRPGVQLGSVTVPQLLRMAERFPHTALVLGVSPAEEVDDGERNYF